MLIILKLGEGHVKFILLFSLLLDREFLKCLLFLIKNITSRKIHIIRIIYHNQAGYPKEENLNMRKIINIHYLIKSNKVNDHKMLDTNLV